MSLQKRLGHDLTVESAVPTPIAQRLPPEVVREIFLACLSRNYHRLSSCEVPWNVSQTCRYWRDVALTTSRLWAFLHYDSSNDMSLPAFEVVLNTWLLRSGSSLLHYTVNISVENCLGESNHAAERIITTMLQHQSRWRDLTLLCDGLCPSEEFSMEMSSMPQIERLALCFAVTFILEDFTLDLASAPNIKNLILECTEVFEPLPEQLQLTNLRSCSLNFPAPPEDNYFADACLQLLHAAPNIEEFRVEFENAETCFPWFSTSINLPLLRGLYMANSIDVTFILGKLTAPALISLSISSELEDSGPVLLDFIKRSQPPLTVVRVCEGFTEEEYLLEALRLLPSLEELLIVDSSLSAHFLEAFSVRGGQQTC
ncbi:hypothetical protein DFH11DRAFT_450891 [Phellopilus nigrolimitatus]|nr:hypothetical protein DFH11DRAFT_450891 [Phellopilus nigrolimitatus]